MRRDRSGRAVASLRVRECLRVGRSPIVFLGVRYTKHTGLMASSSAVRSAASSLEPGDGPSTEMMNTIDELPAPDLLPRPRKNEKMKGIFDQFLASSVRTQEEVRNLRIQNPRGVFVNYTMNMRDVNVFGFDYDYTMANYRWVT